MEWFYTTMIIIFKKITTFLMYEHHRQLQNIWKPLGLYDN